MKIIDLLKKDAIELNTSVASKSDAIDKLVALHEKAGNLLDVNAYKDAILAREAQGSTAIGEGIAVPHAKSESVKTPGLSAITVPNGVDYEAPDGKNSDILFMIAAPLDGDLHLEILSRLMVMLMEPDFCASLRGAKTTDEFLSIIDKKEAEKYPEEPKAEVPKKEGYRILAVTACPTGIAHTYMAAEALQEMAGKMGVAMKVETNGSGGVKNKLTAAEIEEAEGIIVAADKNVPVERFAGKPVIFVKVADGINKPKELIKEILSGNVPAYAGKGGSEATSDVANAEESLGRQIYKHLMNGVSHMLPFVIGGGILIALAFLFDMEFAGTAKFGSGTPLAAFFKNIGGLAFSMMMPILAGYIAMSIGERPALMLGIVGGFLAASGGSGFFGALFAGFIGGYLILALRKVFSVLPDSLEGLKPILLYPVIGLLLMGILMTYVINPPTAAFNQWLAGALAGMSTTSKVLMGFVLGAMMSIDFGGPLNKAAYVFGTAAIAAQAMTNILENLNGIAAIGIGIGLMNVVGECIGAGRKDEAIYYTKKMCLVSEVVIIISCLLVFALTKPIIHLGGMSAESGRMCFFMVTWITIIKPIVWVPAFIPAYSMRAAGDVKFSMILSCTTMWLCRVTLCVVLCRVFGFGPIAVWIGMFSDWTLRGIFYTLRFHGRKWLDHKVIE